MLAHLQLKKKKKVKTNFLRLLFIPLSYKRLAGYCWPLAGWAGGVDTQVCECDTPRTR